MPYEPPNEARIALAPPDGTVTNSAGATNVIDAAHPEIARLATELTCGAASDWDRGCALFAYVRDEISYDFTPDLRTRDDWRASFTLARGKGFCQQKAVLLVALARAARIPSALGFQHIRDHKLLDTRFESLLPGGVIHFHGHAFFHLDGAWRIADATLDASLCARRRYRLVHLSPNAPNDARLPRTDLDGAPHFDFLDETGPYADLPVPITDLLLSLQPTWQALMEVAHKTGATM